MAPLVPRLISILYNGRTLGGSSDIDIDGPVRIVDGPDMVSVSCYIVATAASSSAAATLWDALADDLGTPHKAITITMDSETVLTLDPASNTGFNARPSLELAGTPVVDSRLSRRYRWSVDFDLPADRYDADGRRDSAPTLRHTPANARAVDISGEYRALGGDDAYEQYEEAIGGYADTILARFGLSTSTCDLMDRSVTSDDRNKIASFQRTYQEIMHNEGRGRLDVAAIQGAQLSISRSEDESGYSPLGPNVTRPVTFSVSYSAYVDRDVTADLSGTYNSVSRPQILSSVRDAFGAAAIRSERVTIDPTKRTIACQMELMAWPGDVDQYVRVDLRREDPGNIVLPVWASSKDRDKAYVYQGAFITQHTTTEQWSAKPSFVPSPASSPSGDTGKTWVAMPRDHEYSGITESKGQTRVSHTIRQTWRRVDIYKPPKRTDPDPPPTPTEASKPMEVDRGEVAKFGPRVGGGKNTRNAGAGKD